MWRNKLLFGERDDILHDFVSQVVKKVDDIVDSEIPDELQLIFDPEHNRNAEHAINMALGKIQHALPKSPTRGSLSNLMNAFSSVSMGHYKVLYFF